MSLNLNQLRTFFICCNHATFSDAADTLCLSQPAVTIQMKQLESYCGIDLFQRNKKRIELTDAGKALFEYARKIFDLAESAENAIQSLRDLKTGTLKVGTIKVYGRFMMAALASAFQRKYPGMHVQVEDGRSKHIIESLLAGKIELGLLSMAPPYPPQLQRIPYSQEELFLLLPGDHPLNRREKIRVEDLAGVPLVVRDRASVARDVVVQKYKEAGVEPGPLVEVMNLASIIEQVTTGKGVSFIAEWAFFSEQVHAGLGTSFIASWAFQEQVSRGSLKIRSLEDGPLIVNVFIAHLKNTVLSTAGRAFIDLLLEKRSVKGECAAGQASSRITTPEPSVDQQLAPPAVRRDGTRRRSR